MNQITAKMLFGPTLGWNMLLGRVLRVRRWWDRIDDHIIVGALPFSRDVPGLHNEGIRGVVNTCHEYAGPIDRYERHGIEQFHMRTIDFTHPNLKDVQAAIEFIESHAMRGQSVYVHCKAGRARSATVALCWLIRRHGLSPEEGQQLLLNRRPHINRKLVQRPVVQDFYALHKNEPQSETPDRPESDSPIDAPAR